MRIILFHEDFHFISEKNIFQFKHVDIRFEFKSVGSFQTLCHNYTDSCGSLYSVKNHTNYTIHSSASTNRIQSNGKLAFILATII